MELLLIRHAEPVRIAGGSGAPADPQLTDEGRAQAELLATWLAHEPIDTVLTSPLQRSVQTAEPLAAALDLDLEVVDGLAEYDRGSDSYIPTEELARTNDPRFALMLEGRWQEFGGDDPTEFRQRIEDTITTIVARFPGGRVAAVCHGGVINSALASVVGIDRHLWFEPRYTSVSRIRASRTGVRTIVSVNEHAHFHATRHRA